MSGESNARRQVYIMDLFVGKQFLKKAIINNKETSNLAGDQMGKPTRKPSLPKIDRVVHSPGTPTGIVKGRNPRARSPDYESDPWHISDNPIEVARRLKEIGRTPGRKK